MATVSSDGETMSYPRPVGALQKIVKVVVKLGVNRFRRHEHQSNLVGLAGNKIFVGDIGNVLAHIGTQALGRGFTFVLGLGLAIGGDCFERKLGVDRHRALVRQEHAAVGAGAIGKRALKFVSAFRQSVRNNCLHAQLPERAARLLIGQNALQRCHLGGERSDVLLSAIDNGKPLVQLVQILGGVLRGFLQPSRRAGARPLSRRSLTAC